MRNFLKNNYLYILFISIFIQNQVFAQSFQNDKCAYQSNIERLEAIYPGVKEQMQQKKDEILQNLSDPNNNTNINSNAAVLQTLYTIPVVFHVVWNDPSEDLPEAQILSQLEVLNEDFRSLNMDISNVNSMFQPDIADVEFEFCLTSVDEFGNPTTGITRTQTSTTQFGGFYGSDVMNPADGGVAPWDTDEFLNIFIADIGSFLLGYATPPGGPANQDGVVINYTVVGRGPYPDLIPQYDLGRTATHEIGHYFGLEHPWGTFGGCSDDDGIADTPTSEFEYYGCPAFGSASTTCGSQDNYHLFMDYCDDFCLLMFSEGQKGVMVSTLTTQRAGLLTSIASCDSVIIVDPPPNQTVVNIALNTAESNFVICDNQLSPLLTITNLGNIAVTSFEFVYSINGSADITQFWNGNLEPDEDMQITLFDVPVSSDIVLTIEVQNVNNNMETDLTDNAVLLNYSISVTGTFPLEENFEDVSFMQGGWLSEDDFGINADGWQENLNVGAQSSANCYMVQNQLLSMGSVQYFTTPYLDLFGKTDISLKFDYAYASKVGANNDALAVVYSIDCGNSWNTLHNFLLNDLQTADATISDFQPNNSQWKEKILDLDFLNNQDKVIFRFRSTSGGGNPIYLDNINFNYLSEIPSSINEFFLNNELAIYPNVVTDGTFNIVFNNYFKDATYNLLDMTGKNYQSGELNQFNQINVSNLQDGYYFVQITTQEVSLLKKIIVYN